MNFLQRVFLRFFPIIIYTVVGPSMEPTLVAGTRIIVWKYSSLRIRDIVVFRDPLTELLAVKRITKIKKEEYFLEGDNKKESTDSRDFGWVFKRKILGKIIYPIL